MALLIQPTKITKKLINQIQPYHKMVTEVGSVWGADQIEDLIENLIPLFKTCSLKKQKQVVDKIIDGDVGSWHTNQICDTICDYAFFNLGSVDPKLIKHIYKKYMKQNPGCPQTYKKFVKESIKCAVDTDEERKNAMAYFNP